MKSLTLRRHKLTKINGKPIIELPDITHHVVKLKLKAAELDLYQRIEDKAYSYLEQESVLLLCQVLLISSRRATSSFWSSCSGFDRPVYIPDCVKTTSRSLKALCLLMQIPRWMKVEPRISIRLSRNLGPRNHVAAVEGSRLMSQALPCHPARNLWVGEPQLTRT